MHMIHFWGSSTKSIFVGDIVGDEKLTCIRLVASKYDGGVVASKYDGGVSRIFHPFTDLAGCRV